MSSFNKQIFLLLPFLILLLLKLPADGQNYDEFNFSNTKKKKVVIPFKFIHNLIIIPVSINDSDTLKLILDTGVQTTLLTEVSPEDSVSLNFVQKVKLNGLGDGESLEVYYSSGNKINLPGLVGFNQDIYYLDEDRLLLSPHIGMEVNGLIGYDLLKHFIVEINYLSQTVTFHDRKQFKYKWKKNAEVIPFDLTRSKPYINIKVLQSDGSYIDAKVLVDLGASNSCSLYETTDKRINKPSRTVRAHLGRGLNGDINGEFGRAEYLTIGNFKLEDPIVAFPEEKATSAAVELVQHQGSIGSGILSRFHVIFDYQENKIYLKPNRNFRKKFVYNLSGISITTPVPEFPLFIVERIDDNSPAHIAGIKEGDVLVKVNEKSASIYTLSEVMGLLNSKSGDKVNLTLSRNGKLFKTKIVLKDQI